MSKETAEAEVASAPKGLAKLRAYKEKAQAAGDIAVTLPDSGVEAKLPAYKSNALWMKAQALGDGDQRRANTIYIIQLCTFDGERLTLDEYQEFVSANDHLALVQKVFESEADRLQAATGKK